MHEDNTEELVVVDDTEVQPDALDAFGAITNAGLTVEEYDAERNSFARTLKLFGLFLGLSLLLTLVAVLYPLMALSGAAKAGEPIAEYWKSLPSELDGIAIAERNVMYDKNGEVFAQVWAQDRVELDSLDEISQYAIDGLIATEDKNFYDHGGIDILGTARAAVSGSGGGSGITQQLVKNLQYYNQTEDIQEEATEHSIDRKLRELKYAFDYEEGHTKDEILLEYFNTVAFGSPNTYSIEASSRYEFGKSAADLTLAEAAALVGSTNNPVVYSITDDPEDPWKSRQGVVLNRMYTEGYLTKDEADEAFEEELTLVQKRSSSGNCTTSDYPFYCEYVLDTLLESERLGETHEARSAVLARGGLHINTYLDPVKLERMDSALERDFGNTNRVVAPSALVKAGTGAVEAFAVNREYGNGENETTINVADNPSGTGSAYKPLTLAAAIDNGRSEGSLKFSAPCRYAPNNYDYPGSGFTNSTSCELQGGLLDYKQATAYSSNTWYTTLAANIGLEPIYELSRNMNLNVPDSLSSRSLSFVLGPVENSTIDMAAAYATFVNDGVFCPATPIESFAYADGSQPVMPDSYDPADDACRAVMSPHAASVALKSMRTNTIEGEVPGAFGLAGEVPGHDSVGKSGTNQSYNYAQGQVIGDYGFFLNIYDMDRVTNGIYRNSYFMGRTWSYNYGADATSRVLSNTFRNIKTEKIQFVNGTTEFVEVEIPEREMLTVPNVHGMTPEQAVDAMTATGLTVHVSKDTVAAPEGYESGVIGEQSVDGGTQVPIDSTQEVILHVTR